MTTMNAQFRKICAAMAVFVAAGMAGEARAQVQTQTPNLGSQPQALRTAATAKARNVVLVHGAWADGSSWEKVIPIRRRPGCM
jgi:hypothetical protein